MSNLCALPEFALSSLPMTWANVAVISSSAEDRAALVAAIVKQAAEAEVHTLAEDDWRVRLSELEQQDWEEDESSTLVVLDSVISIRNRSAPALLSALNSALSVVISSSGADSLPQQSWEVGSAQTLDFVFVRAQSPEGLWLLWLSFAKRFFTYKFFLKLCAENCAGGWLVMHSLGEEVNFFTLKELPVEASPKAAAPSTWFEYLKFW